MILPIYTYGQSVLRQISKDIDSNYEGLDQLIDDMFETLKRADGIGLAAPQVGLPIRLVVVDLDILSENYPEYKDFKRVYINARIEETEGEQITFEEGCLSFPGIHEKVIRAKRARITYLDRNFQQHDEWIDDYPARVLQHEVDHLDGKCFIDRMAPLRRQLNKSRLNAISTGKVDCDYKVKLRKK